MSTNDDKEIAKIAKMTKNQLTPHTTSYKDIDTNTQNSNFNKEIKLNIHNAHEKSPLKSENNIDYSTVSQPSQPSITMTNETTSFDLWKGLFYMFLSCICKSLFSILSKWALQDVTELSSFQLLSYRSFFMLWITVALISILPIDIFSDSFVRRDKFLNVLVRTVFAIISISTITFVTKFMNISDVFSVYYVYPGFIILLSLIFLKNDKLGKLDYFCLLSCFVGVILIVKPEFIFHQKQNNSRMIFFGIVLIGALIKAIEDILVRDVGKQAHFLVFPFMYSIFGMVLFPIPMVAFDVKYPPLTFFQVFVIFLIAICSFLYQTFMALGLQNENASRVSMVNYMQVALMFLSDLFIFDKEFNMLDMIGTMLIFGFNFANGFYKASRRFGELNSFKSRK